TAIAVLGERVFFTHKLGEGGTISGAQCLGGLELFPPRERPVRVQVGDRAVIIEICLDGSAHLGDVVKARGCQAEPLERRAWLDQNRHLLGADLADLHINQSLGGGHSHQASVVRVGGYALCVDGVGPKDSYLMKEGGQPDAPAWQLPAEESD